ncbi:MICOS complex subunit MIC60 isoform X3 [Hemitrygon akajei]|uniref:MICOS complex subunit MIC60 isoform X3 n=1 Tax=Hemitrygon akajei TaxID=2704970 RepID=UPI003BF9B470
MLRASKKVAPPLKKCLCGKSQLRPLQQYRGYQTGSNVGASVGKIVGGSVLFIGGGLGGTLLYAKWDPKFRQNVEKAVPYSDKVFELTLGPPSVVMPPKKQDMAGPLKISTTAEVLKDSKQPKTMRNKDKEVLPIEETVGESKSCGCENEGLKGQHVEERSPEEVAKHLKQKDHEVHAKVVAITSTLEDALGKSAQLTLQAVEAQDSAVKAITSHAKRLKEAMDDSEHSADRKSEQWRALEDALSTRNKVVDSAAEALAKAREELKNLRNTIEEAKEAQIPDVRPQLLAAEKNLNNMAVDLDNVVKKVEAAQSEAKIVVQYSELVAMARDEFRKELESITPEVQTGWKNLTGQLSTDDLNSLIAHAHRRIDQLNRELAEQQVREKQHIEKALEHQKLENKKALEMAVTKALEHYQSERLLEQDKKIEEVREAMEVEMRTQLRRQAAAHTDHLRDVLKVQEQEFKGKYKEELQQKLSEYEMQYRRLSQEQLDNFTLEMNAAYSRLKGIEKAMESHVVAEEEARKAHQLWLSIEALQYTLKTASGDSPTEPLQNAIEAITNSCGDDKFTQALAGALPQECLSRGVYSEEALRHRFYTVRKIARRVAMIDETRNSLFQYFLSYLQSFLLMEPQVTKPPEELHLEGLDTFKLLSFASFCIEHGDLELAAKFVNQLRGEPRRVAQDWLAEARLTLETKQIIEILSAYANAVGLGTTQVE